MDRKTKTRIFTLCVILFFTLFSVYFAFKESRSGILTVTFLNIGQGDAIFIDTPKGRQVLIDAGPDRSILRELSAVLPFYDRSIDVAIATHADQDHIGGMPDVLKKYKTDLFLEPGVSGKSSSYQELEKMVFKDETIGDIKKILVHKRMVLDLGSDVILYILFPDRDPTGMETNTASIVAKLVYGESEFILTGDSPEQIEEYLVLENNKNKLGLDIDNNPINLEADVLKAGHHGSRTSTSLDFVKSIHPKYAVISSGKENKYGHPHKEVLDILNTNGVQILNIAEIGRIVFKTDGKVLEIK